MTDHDPTNGSSSIEKQTENNQLDTLRSIQSLNDRLLVFGGFAEDSWTDQRPTRPHGDIDVVTMRHDSASVLEELERQGWVANPAEMAGKIYKYVCKNPKGVSMDIVVLDAHEDGTGSVDVDDRGTIHTMQFEADDLQFDTSSICGIEVKTVNPSLQMKARCNLSQFSRHGG